MSIQLSLQYHDKLNPKLWDGWTLKTDVRDKLLEIARKWQDYARIPDDAVHDIVLTGGNANLNFTDQSDIDVHLIVDIYRLPIQNTEILQDFLRSKKDLWAANHDIKVKGYSVELYAQDMNQDIPVLQGVWSLMNNDWVIRPRNLHLDFENDFGLKSKVEDFMRRIDTAIASKQPIEAAKELKNKITSLRGASIQKSGEFSVENLLFKELRNTGYLQKISDYINQKEDRRLSLEHVM